MPVIFTTGGMSILLREEDPDVQMELKGDLLDAPLEKIKPLLLKRLKTLNPGTYPGDLEFKQGTPAISPPTRLRDLQPEKPIHFTPRMLPPLLNLNELYLPVAGLSAEAFKNPLIDEESLHLLHLGGPDQRYAVVGFIVGSKIHLRFRPGFEPHLSEEKYAMEKAAQEKIFGKDKIVIAKEGSPGRVHQAVLSQVLAVEPHLTEAKTIGLSVKKRKDGNLEWLNRSVLNLNIFIRNPLALCCFMMPGGERDAYSLEYHLSRSIKASSFEELANAFGLLLSRLPPPELKVSGLLPRSETFFGPLKNPKVEARWDEIRLMANAEEQLGAIQQMLLQNIFWIAAMPPAPQMKEARSGFENALNLILDQARKCRIPLNLETTRFGTSILCSAASNGYTAICKKLLDHGARLHSRDAQERLPWTCAAEKGHWHTTKFLYENLGRAEKEEAKPALLHCAKQMLQSLEQLHPSVDDERSKEKARELLANFSDIDSYFLRLNLEFKAWNQSTDPDDAAKTPLLTVAALGYTDLTAFFYNKEEDPVKKTTALHTLINAVAAREDAAARIEEIMLQFPGKKQVQYARSRYALMQAIKTGLIESLEVLPEIKASREDWCFLTQIDGGELLQQALTENKLALVEKLLELEFNLKTRATDPIHLDWSTNNTLEETLFETALLKGHYPLAERFYLQLNPGQKTEAWLRLIDSCATRQIEGFLNRPGVSLGSSPVLLKEAFNKYKEIRERKSDPRREDLERIFLMFATEEARLKKTEMFRDAPLIEWLLKQGYPDLVDKLFDKLGGLGIPIQPEITLLRKKAIIDYDDGSDSKGDEIFSGSSPLYSPPDSPTSLGAGHLFSAHHPLSPASPASPVKSSSLSFHCPAPAAPPASPGASNTSASADRASPPSAHSHPGGDDASTPDSVVSPPPSPPGKPRGPVSGVPR